MAKSSIHIIPVKGSSEIHNKRLKEYDYVRSDLTHLNESWEGESLKSAKKRIAETYQNSTGQKIQKKATPLREGVVNLNPEHTLEDLHRLKDALFEKFGVKTIQIHIHRDEGYQKTKKGEWKQNLHAHMVFDWTDSKGKTLKLNRWEISEMQTLISETLGMERGISSDKTHLSSIAYKVQQIEQDIEELQKQSQEYIDLLTPPNLDDYLIKTLFGKKIDEEKIQNLILSEKNKASIIQGLTDNNLKLKQETDEILATYKQELERLQKEQEELEKQKNELNRLKNDYFNRIQHLAHQQGELTKLRELKGKFDALNQKYETLKKYEGLTYSKKFIEESVSFRNLQEEIITEYVLKKLQENFAFRDKEELFEIFQNEMKKHGFYENWKENPFFDKFEADLNFQYRSRGMRL